MNIDFSPDSVDIIAKKLYMAEISVEEALQWMKVHGSSVCLNYGEDNDLWECSWITSGKRYTGFSKEVRGAIVESMNNSFMISRRNLAG